MEGKVCTIIAKIKYKALLKCPACTQQLQAMLQTSCRLSAHSLLPSDNPNEILQPYR